MSFLPDNLPPLPPSPPPSSSAVAAMSNNYLSSIPTPPLSSTTTTTTSNLMIPSNTMNMSSAAAYQQYYQQYMYSMYSSMYGSVPPPLPQQQTTTTPNFNYKQPTLVNATTNSTSQITNNNNNSGTKEPTIVNTNQQQQQTKQAIKFNLKFQNNLAENGVNTKKSRFNNNNNSNSLANITAEQEQFKKQQQTEAAPPPPPPPPKQKEEEETVSTTASSATADIVADINKWPATLKAYCTKVYQFYSKQTAVSEDQVTKYLQQRITDTFKLKPDLNIDWDNEKIPDLSDIKQVAPLSQLQIQQQKRQQKMHEAALAMAKAKAAEILAQKQKLKQQLETTSLAAEISKNKRKYEHDHESRSGSKSSTSSSESSSENNKDFISLTTTTTNNNKKVKKAINSMQKIEKKKLKNIQINNMNGKKVFKNLVSKRKSSDETSDGEDDDEDDDEEEEEEEENAENQKQQKLLTTPNKFLSKKQKKLKANLINRQKRFQNGGKNQRQQVNNRFTRTLFSSNSYKETSGDADLNEVCIGLNQDLEKEYLRLTGPPEPVMIRPQAVLKKSLVHVLEKYSRTNDYRYICDQMKAIRQDLTVQMIQNEFTVEVYETHARIAIKNKDRDEFNQCQSQLKNLYILLEKNASLTSEQESKSIEFIGYRLVYNMLTKSHTDLNQVIKEIKLKYSSHSYLNHLLALRNAWHLNNYVKFFRLYKQCNEMSKCLIDLFIERERKLALKYIIKAYRPAIKLECVKEMLAYETIQKCKDDLISYKLTLQSVPLVIEEVNKNLSNSKSNSSSSSSKQLFEDILDCKSCNIQF